MSLEQFASLAEIIGGLAVVTSLIYLAIQIRQNTQTIKSATLLGNTEIWSNLLLDLASEHNIKAYLAGSLGSAEIKPREFTQFFLQCRVLFVSFEHQYYQYSNGSLDEETYKGYERSIANQLLAYPGFRLYWKMCREHFSPVFVEYLDAVIANTPEEAPGALLGQWRQLANKEAPHGQ